MPTGERWEGKTQVEVFYRAFLTSFDQMEWVPQALVIGPQGVLDVVNMTGLLRKPFAGLVEVDQPVHLQWVIYFPWAPDAGKLRGEIIYSIRRLTERNGCGSGQCLLRRICACIARERGVRRFHRFLVATGLLSLGSNERDRKLLQR